MRPASPGAALAGLLLAACAGGTATPPRSAAPGPEAGDALLEALAAEPPEHRIWGEETGPGAAKTSMLDRLRRAAHEFRDASVSRVAFVELRFPAHQAEYAALGGHSVLRLTAVCRDAAELPPARVFVRGEAGETELARLRLAASEVPDSEPEIARAIGRFRADALYLVPLQLMTGPGQLLVDFARNRSDFVLAGLPLALPELGYTLEPPSGDPQPEALEHLIHRDLPELATPPTEAPK